MKAITPIRLVLISCLFMLLFSNYSFFSNLIKAYPIDKNLSFIVSVAIIFYCFHVLAFSLLSIHKLLKPVLVALLIISSLAAYFMDTYHIIIDSVMLDNVVRTDPAESMDLLSLKLLAYLFLLGILPSIFIIKIKVEKISFKKDILSRINTIILMLLIMLITMGAFNKSYISFFREQKIIRSYASPSYPIYAFIKLIKLKLSTSQQEFSTLAEDAEIAAEDYERELVIFVLGETVRADHLSLNGYKKNTTPYLQQEDILSFKQVSSCGTSTAVSVPCLFSVYGRDEYRQDKALSTENLLDILQKSGVNVLWLDNNSDSKGVALRVPYESYKSADKNPICDIECRDVGMLSNLQKYIDEHPTGDIFIVLHQMGNHGPAYFKRYPPEFEKFTPTCKTNLLEECTQEQISNTYDNAILYTDYFLSQVIQLLKNNNNHFETSMLYVSDHGESLGENGLYLHGMPYFLAPESQTHVAFLMWFGTGFDIREDVNFEQLKQKLDKPYSHDHVFHSVLGLMEIETSVYKPEMDIFH